jgi:hypothetical protein
MSRFAYLMPDYWLEVGPATSRLGQGFPWFSSILEQMLSWYPPKFHSALHNSHTAFPMLDQNSAVMDDFQRLTKINCDRAE